jgi:solute:Na+ symporter, SSS family
VPMLDSIITLLYLFVIFALAFMSKRSKLNFEKSDKEIVADQYLASRSLTLVESMGSIIATEVSALTFLGIPAFAFSKDFSFVHIYIGAILGRLIIARLIVPKIYGKGITLYQIMAKDNSTEKGEMLTALIYSITKLLAVGVRLYAGSILVAEFFHLNIIMALIIITTITFFYTLIGGLKAVVRTDLLQTFLFVSGGVAAHFVIPEISGQSWESMMSLANENGKTAIFVSNHWQDFFIGVSGGILFDMCTHGVDQDFTQRLMGAKSKKIAQQSIFFSSFFSIIVGLLFLSVGALLWSHFQVTALPEGIKADRLFAWFITEHFPSPIKGLMLAGVLAATMSTLDSTINALSSVLWSNLWPNRDISKIRTYLRTDTLIISILLLIVAIISSQSDGILILGLKIASWTGGALAALFFSQLVWPKFMNTEMNGTNVLLAWIFNLSGVALNTFILDGPWQWNVYYGMFFGTLYLFIRGKFNKI